MSSYLINEILIIPSLYLFIFIYLVRFVIVLSGSDWFMVWLGLEVNIMSFLILIYRRYRLSSVETCLKYFFIQSLGSVLLIIVFYLNYYMIGGVASLVLAYKVGAGPFFYWFPSVCSGLDWVSCFFLIVFQKLLPLSLIVMFVHWMLWMVALLRLIVGVFGSFNQRNIKQLMAYSSVHHLGWLLIIGLRSRMDWILYLFIYALVLFRVVILLIRCEVVDLSIIYISERKVWFMLRIFRIAGIPPLLGFYLKWMALVNVVEFGILLVIFLVLVSVIILYVYLRIVYDIIMGSGITISLFRETFELYNYEISIISLLGVIGGVFIGLYIII